MIIHFNAEFLNKSCLLFKKLLKNGIIKETELIKHRIP